MVLKFTNSGSQVVPVQAGASVKLKSSRHRAAALFLPNGADHSAAAYVGWFRSCAKRHARSWLDFIKSTGLVTEDHQGVVFVTGYYLADKWATAVIRNSEVEAEGRFGISLPKIGGTFSIKATKAELFEVPLRVGPKIKQENSNVRNQCVFLKGLSIFERGIRPFRIKAAAGPHDLDMDRDRDSCPETSSFTSDSGDEDGDNVSKMLLPKISRLITHTDS